jgi:hypothetical protein
MNVTKTPYSGLDFAIETIFILILIWVKYIRQFRTDYKRVCPQKPLNPQRGFRIENVPLIDGEIARTL